MSHFVCLVITPEDTTMEEVPAAVESLMAHYDEALRVDSHERECWCVGMQARKEVQAEVEKQYPLEELRGRFARLPETKRTERRWLAMGKPRVAMETELLERHPLNDMPSETCANCDGVGLYYSEANPDGKWDWWVIGGRWDGWIYGPERESASHDEKGFNLGEEHQTAENNTRPVRDIPIDDPNYVPFAVVTPDGQWHQEGTMHMWAIVTDALNPEEWQRQVKELFAQYPNHLAVAVDCHA
jgi:hypothetical protein